MSHASSLNIGEQFAKSWQALKTKFTSLILSIFIIISLIIAAVVLSFGLYQLTLTSSFLMKNILAYNIGARIFFYLLYLILGIFAQIILINVFLKNYISFKENLLSFCKHFWQMLVLNIFLNLLFLVLSSPFYAAIIFFIMNNPVLGYASILAGIILTILGAVLLLFSPFILIDKNTDWLSALKISFNISKNHIFPIAFNLLILAFIFIILNLFSMVLISMPLLYMALGTILSLFLIMFCFSYLFVMYQDYKQ
jgi:hypothetical protein